jgi:CO/xanthine dehydrogenase FAD-binding subunit
MIFGLQIEVRPMTDLEWYYPERMEEVPELISRDGVLLHAGGTGILRMNPRRVKGLVDLRRLSLDCFKIENGTLELGSMLTYAGAAEHLAGVRPGSILTRSLSLAASTPLRNRITIGGSVAHFPAWSDLVGPLIALEAEVGLAGAREGRYPITEYVRSADLRRGSIVTGVIIRDDGWLSRYYRASRTTFDYAAFNTTIIAKLEGGRVEDLRIVVVGTTERFTRLRDIEQILIGRPASEAKIRGLGEVAKLEFPARGLGSPEYLRHLAGVELERGLETLLKG